ncbi:MAG: hypothetical protein U1E81_17915 [Xanthobacteraceae bacterium]
MESTQNLISDIPGRVGRKKRWAEDMQARFPEGTFARINSVLSGKEDRTDFVRAAVERELKRRERAKERAEEED